MKAVGLNQPAEGDRAICQRFRHGFRAEGPWPSASAWPLSRTPTSSPLGSRPGSSWRPRGTSDTPSCWRYRTWSATSWGPWTRPRSRSKGTWPSRAPFTACEPRPKAFSAGPEGPWGHCPLSAYYDGPGQGFTSADQGGHVNVQGLVTASVALKPAPRRVVATSIAPCGGRP